MSKIAFLFSGQGSQHPGMGMGFYNADGDVRRLFDAAESIRPGTLAQMSDGSPEILNATENTQPCLYLADMAAAIYMKNAGVSPDFLAGFSLGEIPALSFSGAFSYEEGFKIVCERARLMGIDAKKRETGMAAVLKLSNEQVEEICGRFDGVYPVNYNAPGQVTVAGDKAVLGGALEAFKAAGGRAVPLAVSGGFHSPFMDGAAAAFGEFLKTKDSKVPSVPVYANRTAEPYRDKPTLTLGGQINNPVLWEKTVKNMVRDGAEIFIETGVGTVLRNLIGKILPGARAYSAETPEQAADIIKEVL